MKLHEKIGRIDNFYIAYHRTQKENMEPIIQNGFRPGYGAMYGKGFYLTYDLSSQTRRSMTHYGDGIIKAKINPKNLLIFDYNLAKDVFGNDYSLEHQLIKHYKIYRDILDIPRNLYVWSEELESTFKNPTFSADVAYNKFVQSYIDSSGRCKIKGIRGIIFTGNHDGNVLVLYSHETAVPFEFAITDPSSGELITEWLPVKNFDRVVGRANMAEFALDKFDGKVSRIEVDKYDLSRIERDFKWLFQADMEKAVFKIHDNKTFEWIDGIWKRGHWYGDIWNNGIFKSGVWNKGEFLAGDFEYGSFLKGAFSGTWHDGIWRGGTWKSKAFWYKGEIQDKRGALIHSEDNPEYFFSFAEKIIPLSDIASLYESFNFNSLSSEEKDELFDTFEISYKQAVGVSWDKGTFISKASQWLFFGSTEGGLAVRRQNSGMYKMNAVYGSPRNIIAAYHEMVSEIGREPIWGVMTDDIANMLERLSRKEFKRPPKLFAKTVIPHISHIFGDNIAGYSNDGGIIVQTPAGKMTKYFVANKKYYKTMLDNAANDPDRIPVPKPVLKTLIAMLKLIV